MTDDSIIRLRKTLKQQNKIITDLKKLFEDYEKLMRKSIKEASKRGNYER